MSQASAKPFICTGSFNPPQKSYDTRIIISLILHMRKLRLMKVKNLDQINTACKLLWSLNLKPAQGYLPDPLTIVQACPAHFQTDFHKDFN